MRNPAGDRPWGERLGADSAAAADERSARRMVREAIGVVRGRLGEVTRHGVRPLLDEAAAQVRPATLEELRARYPGLPDDEVARRLVDRASRTAAAVALGIGGVLAAQEAAALAPPLTGGALSAVGVTALAEVLVLFVVEAKLRADLGALAGDRPLSPRELVAGVLGEVQAAGGWRKLRSDSLRRVLPEAALRRLAGGIARLVPRRFARVVVPEVIAPLIGAAIAARLASGQVRAAGERHWAELRQRPHTTVVWGDPADPGALPPPP